MEDLQEVHEPAVVGRVGGADAASGVVAEPSAAPAAVIDMLALVVIARVLPGLNRVLPAGRPKASKPADITCTSVVTGHRLNGCRCRFL